MRVRGNYLLLFILSFGVFGILNTEMGVIGILPDIAAQYDVSVTQAGLLVSLFAFAVALAGPTMPLLFSGIDRKKVMLLVLSIFIAGNMVSIFTNSFNVLLLARIIPAFFHPIYCSLAFTVAAASVSKDEATKAVSKVFIGVSAGMVVGVPIVSFIATAANLQLAMAFFAIVNIIVFIATLLFLPSMPVKERLSYGRQLSVLKKSITLLSIVGVILLNSAVFGVYSYFAEYLKTVTNMSPKLISLIFFIFGSANIIGNVVAGKLLTKNASKTVVIYPFILAIVYIILFFTGGFTVSVLFITLAWGILAGIGGNINQYWITSSAPKAPDFANGLFLSACNIGTTIGAAVGGTFITELGTRYVILVGILSLILGLVSMLFRNYLSNSTKQLSL
ncbi:MFS transporter [Bacillus sp. FJAT-25509]|uniref:MFS transporter n=1 Tax=Bacillus sp. FJAT-25509 TaxID=1712029 RepID=UPI00256FB34A|nr:MFS transporter [Bacillus sp. FJAT-25509]